MAVDRPPSVRLYRGLKFKVDEWVSNSSQFRHESHFAPKGVGHRLSQFRHENQFTPNGVRHRFSKAELLVLAVHGQIELRIEDGQWPGRRPLLVERPPSMG